MGLSRKKAPLRRTSKRASTHIPRPSWKLLGLAGVAGVAATGVVVARKRRAHVDLQPDELRERLHERLQAASAGAAQSPDPPA